MVAGFFAAEILSVRLLQVSGLNVEKQLRPMHNLLLKKPYIQMRKAQIPDERTLVKLH
jgi:hypothetical protein